jgi:hypothetical protein
MITIHHLGVSQSRQPIALGEGITPERARSVGSFRLMLSMLACGLSKR